MIWYSRNSRIAQIIDFVTAISGYYVAILIATNYFTMYSQKFVSIILLHEEYHLLFSISSGIFSVLLFWFSGAYSFQRFTSFRVELLIVFRVSLYLLIITMLSVLLIRYDLPRAMFGIVLLEF